MWLWIGAALSIAGIGMQIIGLLHVARDAASRHGEDERLWHILGLASLAKRLVQPVRRVLRKTLGAVRRWMREHVLRRPVKHASETAHLHVGANLTAKGSVGTLAVDRDSFEFVHTRIDTLETRLGELRAEFETLREAFEAHRDSIEKLDWLDYRAASFMVKWVAWGMLLTILGTGISLTASAAT